MTHLSDHTTTMTLVKANSTHWRIPPPALSNLKMVPPFPSELLSVLRLLLQSITFDFRKRWVPVSNVFGNIFKLWRGAKNLETATAPKSHCTQTWTPGARLGGEARTQRDLSPFCAQEMSHEAESHPCQPLTLNVYSPAQIRGAELAPVPALTNARADEFNSPWLPSALSDGLPQLRCKLWQSHVNLTCKTKNLCVFGEMAEGRDYEALLQCKKNNCISQHLKERIKAPVLWEEGNTNGKARNLHFK